MTAATRPLVLTEDPLLLDELLRLSAVAGVEVVVARAPDRAAWLAAPHVVVGVDVVARCLRAGLPRRSGVTLLGTDLDDATVWQSGVALGAEHVVFLPDAEPWLVEQLAESVEPSRSAAPVIGVLGGRGGAGATSLAVGLALTAARRGDRSWLIDGDLLGGGIDLVLGGEDVSGARWPDVAQARGRLPSAALGEAVPVLHDVRVVSASRTGSPPDAEAVPAVLGAARRGADLVVVDLPRSPSRWLERLLAEVDHLLLVVPLELRAAAAAAQLAAYAQPLCRGLQVVTRGPAPSGLRPEEAASLIGVPLLHAMRPQQGLPVLLERGEPPGSVRGSLASSCQELLDLLLPEAAAA